MTPATDLLREYGFDEEADALSWDVPKHEWEWFGNHGHFICGRWCRFHLTTKVGKYLVSTVGEYIHPRHSGGSENAENDWLEANYPGEDIGIGRKYETMVFIAGDRCKNKKCGCNMPSITGYELVSDPANTAGEATINHMRACELAATNGIQVDEDEYEQRV